MDEESAGSLFAAASGFPVASLEHTKTVDLATAPASWGPLDAEVAAALDGYRIEVFPIAAGLLMASLMLAYGHRRWLSLVIYSVVVTAFVYVVFGMLLRIPL